MSDLTKFVKITRIKYHCFLQSLLKEVWYTKLPSELENKLSVDIEN